MAENTPSRPFFDFLREYRKLFVAMASLGALNAVVELVMAIGPPWPNRLGTTFFTVLWTWGILIWSFSILRHGGKQRLQAIITRTLLGFLATCVMYATLNSFFVYDTPKSGYQVAGGFILRKQMQEVLKKYPDFTIEEALDGEAYRSTSIWEPWTVRTIQAVLLITWLAVFGLMALLCSVFLLYQEMNSKPWGEAQAPSTPARPRRQRNQR